MSVIPVTACTLVITVGNMARNATKVITAKIIAEIFFNILLISPYLFDAIRTYAESSTPSELNSHNILIIKTPNTISKGNSAITCEVVLSTPAATPLKSVVNR